jgi:hypothetical protein
MRLILYASVKLLLLKFFVKTLGRQLYLKLTKFTRRSRGPKSLLRKFAASCEFLRDMSRYNWHVIQSCRLCLNRLSAGKVGVVLVYGEKDIIEVLSDLSLERRIKMRLLCEPYELKKRCGWKTIPVELAASRSEQIIVASLIDTKHKMSRLRELGIRDERIILLT